MTGKYETELAAIVNASAWAIPKLEELKVALAQLQKNMNTIAAAPGWTGASADSASEMFSAIKNDFAAAEIAVDHIHEALSLANTAKTAAAEAYHQLPGVSVPNDIRAAIDNGAATVSVAYLSPVPIAADKVFDLALDFFGNQREDQAKTALQGLQSQLHEPSNLLATQNSALDPAGLSKVGGDTKITPDPAPTPVSTPSNHYRGSAAGLGGSSLAPNESVPTTDPGPNLPVLPSGPSVDGGLDGGTVPGSGSGSGSGLGSGQGVGGIGAGIGGSAAAAAGLAVASRLGGGLGAAGGLGSASPLGSGGLLGSGKAGAGGAAEEGAGGAGAGKPGTSMMGQGGGGGSRNKEKRAGLGGIIAPKLDDEEEVGPRSSRAMAGGRDTTTGK